MTDLREYQNIVDATMAPPVAEELAGSMKELHWAASELAAEANEVLGVVVKLVRRGHLSDDIEEISADTYNKIFDELGDTLWGVASVANAVGIKLDDVILHNQGKVRDRYRKAWGVDPIV